MKIEIDPTIFKHGRITYSAFKVYIWLCTQKRPKPITLKELATHLWMDETTIQKNMTLLEKQGFIAREKIGRHKVIYHAFT